MLIIGLKIIKLIVFENSGCAACAGCGMRARGGVKVCAVTGPLSVGSRCVALRRLHDCIFIKIIPNYFFLIFFLKVCFTR